MKCPHPEIYHLHRVGKGTNVQMYTYVKYAAIMDPNK